MLVNCSQDRKGEGSPFRGSWPSLALAPSMLTGGHRRAAGAFSWARGKAGETQEARCLFLQPTQSLSEGPGDKVLRSSPAVCLGGKHMGTRSL